MFNRYPKNVRIVDTQEQSAVRRLEAFKLKAHPLRCALDRADVKLGDYRGNVAQLHLFSWGFESRDRN